MVVLEAEGLSKHFRGRSRLFGSDSVVVRAVDGISFTIEGGQTLGVVGESGCGKTTTAKLVLGLEQPTGGGIRFEGRDLNALDVAGRRYYRRSVQAVFQDPYASLNPRMRVSAIIAEPLVTNEQLTAGEVRKRVLQLLDLVGLPSRSADLFPHEFSGGQRQRARPRAVTQAHRAGRAGLRPRRIHPGADPQPPARSAGGAEPILSVHRPRSRGRRPYESRDCGHVPGQDRRMRRGSIARSCAEASLYPSALFRGAAEPSRGPAGGDCPVRRGAEPAASAVRLSLSPALSQRYGALRATGTGARSRGRSPGGLPSLRAGRSIGSSKMMGAAHREEDI
jgi:ABC-type lipoprotein export system ATPase subunit